MPPVPLSVEGASVLHQMMRFRRAEWRALTAAKRSDILAGATAAFQRAREIAILTNDVECQKQAEGRLAQIAGGK